jgi:DHA1 family tetracycline resistance protein-like MFS transporter
MGILFFIVFIDLVGFGVVIPLLPYYALSFHATPFAVTMMLACYSLAQFFSSPLLGRLSDRIGRKPVILASLVCSIAAYIWLGFATQLWMLYGARLLAGAGAGNISAAQAYVADVTPPSQRAKGMGMIGAAFGLGFTLGPAMGGLLAGGDPNSPHLAWPAFLAAGFSALAFVLAAILLKESLTHESRSNALEGRLAAAKKVFTLPSLRLLILLFFTITAAFSGMETTFALWAHEGFGWGPIQVGGIFFYVGVLLVAVQGGLIGKLSKRFGEANLVFAGSILIALGLFGLPFATVLWGVLAATTLLTCGLALLNPSINSLISQEAGAHERGGVLGVAQSAASLARIVGPAVAGAVYTGFGRNAPYFLAAAVMAAMVVPALRVRRAHR